MKAKEVMTPKLDLVSSGKEVKKMRKKHFTGLLEKRSVIFSSVIAAMALGLTAMPVVAAKPQLTDISITDAVEDELLMDSAVPSYLIDVTTTEGIVRLSGSVKNILAKERAARIARTVKGVRAVVNKIQVDPPIMRTDQQIRDDVKEALLDDPATDSYEIGVKVEDNVVTLLGTVDSWQERELCEKVAKGVKGVKGVSNKIRVSWPKKRPDYEIKAEVEKALEWDAFIDHAFIDVEVKDGRVMLSGIVGSAAEKRWASIDAYVHEVKFVDDSRLEVKRWARDKDLKGEKYAKKSEKEIEDAVKDALLYDPRVFSFKVTPEVADDGTTVILRGTVDNLKAKRAAAQDARNTVGVREVKNRIKVRPAELLSDQKIEDMVRRALLRNPYVESYEITVDVTNGVAKLYGTVDSYFEKSQADDVASRVNGVITVDNNLIVQDDYNSYIYDPYVDDSFLYDYDWFSYRPRFPAKSDLRIKEDIEDELWWSPFVDSDDVSVTVEEGKATLSGTVDSWLEYAAAQDNAYEGGAVYVENDLVVKRP
jgi:osmotically-inducible protein OsmY